MTEPSLFEPDPAEIAAKGLAQAREALAKTKPRPSKPEREAK